MNIEINGVSGDILKSLQTLYATPAGTVVFDRDYGINWDSVDYPPETAAAMLMVEVMEKTERYEPRAIIRSITPTATADGILDMKVVVASAI